MNLETKEDMREALRLLDARLDIHRMIQGEMLATFAELPNVRRLLLGAVDRITSHIAKADQTDRSPKAALNAVSREALIAELATVRELIVGIGTLRGDLKS